MLMLEVQDYLIASINGYSLSSTFSIRIQGLPFGPPLLIILTILKKETTIIGIHKYIAGLSIPNYKNIYDNL
tara:strand:- start:278 stop:493 length:216 start_codon:yes stop_codon:yes gene_type:complete